MFRFVVGRPNPLPSYSMRPIAASRRTSVTTECARLTGRRRRKACHAAMGREAFVLVLRDPVDRAYDNEKGTAEHGWAESVLQEGEMRVNGGGGGHGRGRGRGLTE